MCECSERTVDIKSRSHPLRGGSLKSRTVLIQSVCPVYL